MFGVRHRLDQEFPEFNSLIEQLKSQDADFSRLCNEYQQTDKKIYGYEIKQRPVADGYMEQLKRLRVRMKDDLYSRLRRYASMRTTHVYST